MNKYAVIGLIFLVLAGTVFGYQELAKLMETEDAGETLTLVSIIDKESFKWIDGIDIDIVKSSLVYVAFDAPLWGILAVLGGLFLLISGFIKR